MASYQEFIKKMPIGAWGSPCPGSVNGTDFISDENYRLARDCGLRFLCTLYELGNREENRRALEAAHRQGIALILNDREFYEGKLSPAAGREKLEYYRSFPAFLGVSIRDEPGIADFGTLKEVVETFGPAMGDAVFYTNLMPLYASVNQLQKGCCFYGGEEDPETYRAYLSEFVRQVDIPMLSYDFYPFRKEKGWTDSRFFLQLALAKEYAAGKNVPFWVFIQVVTWQVGEIRSMTYSEILWQVSASLACGAKGIQYFTFITPIDANSEFFGEAMLDRSHRPTELYHYVSKVNRHLSPAGDALMPWRHVGVMHGGDTLAPVPDELTIPAFGEYRVHAENYLCGCFEGERGRAIYLMNPSLFESRHFAVDLPAERAHRVILGASENTCRAPRLDLVLEPGEGVLITEI